MTQHNFSIGDAVVDSERPKAERSVGRVINPNNGKICDHSVNGIPLPEYDSNEGYSPDETAVTVVFEDDLNRYAAPWTDWNLEALDKHLSNYEEEWHISVSRYTYPASRLNSVEDTETQSVTASP